MPEPINRVVERRLDVWRRAIYLFDRTTHEQGPFYSAGYADYMLEPKMSNNSTPDIIGVSPEWFVLCDVTMSQNKDLDSFPEYSQAEMSDFQKQRFGERALRTKGADPFLITSESGLRAFPHNFNAIQVYPPFERHLGGVHDPGLPIAFAAWVGFGHPPPNYSLLALPESDPAEIKLQLAGLLLQVAARGATATAEELTDKLLGDLASAFRPGGKNGLVDKVTLLLEQANGFLGELCEFDKKSKSISLRTVSSHQGRAAFTKRIKAWLGTRFIEYWDTGEEVRDDSEENEEGTDP